MKRTNNFDKVFHGSSFKNEKKGVNPTLKPNNICASYMLIYFGCFLNSLGDDFYLVKVEIEKTRDSNL